MSTRGKRSALSMIIGAFVAGAALIAGGLPAAASTDVPGSRWSPPDPAAQSAARQRALAASPETPQAGSTSDGGFHTLAAYDPKALAVGNLISDANFFNGSAMTAAAVQSFLAGKVPTCTAGYTCLKDYKQTTTTRPGDPMCTTYTGGANQPASKIIADVGAACGISQKALLVLLQKESQLVLSTAPTSTQYAQATGYSCPDTGADCDTKYGGFFNQVIWAAWQFKRYANPPGTSVYFTQFPVGKVSQIDYSTNASCGSGPVAMWNEATRDLYYYTPYQPNAASIASYPLAGDKCSEYGNRNFYGIYLQWFGDPRAGTVPSVTRASGADRYAVAVSISQASYPGTNVGAVYIASGMTFPDALSAAPAAAMKGGPLLLVKPTSVPSNVLAEVKRLNPGAIYIVGGTGSVSQSVESTLRTVTPKVTRLAGADRYAASRNVVIDGWLNSGTKTASTVYLATGTDFPDALSAGAAAGKDTAPVLLVNGSAGQLDAASKSLLASLKTQNVFIVGGPASVSTGIESQLRTTLKLSVIRFGGADRFAVSAALNASRFGSAPASYLANGFVFPDALAGAAAAGAAKSPLYVVKPTCVPSAAASGSLGMKPSKLNLLGGPASVSDEVGKLTVCR